MLLVPGSHWDVVLLSNNRIRLRLVVARVQKLFLDSTGSPRVSPSISVYLKDQTAGGGSHWLPTKFAICWLLYI